MGRSIELCADFDADDILRELRVKDIIDWIDRHARDFEKEKLRTHLTVHYKIPFATHKETLDDVLKTEVIERIWNKVTVEDLEKLEK
jgi:hypothetical protein